MLPIRPHENETSSGTSLPVSVSEVAATLESTCIFDPSIHLAPLEVPIEHIMMKELGYEASIYSSVAATKPVPLFTPEAVRRIRAEIFDRETLSRHMYSDNISPCVVRGHCPDRARFTYNAITHPAVRNRMNEMAGIEITHVYEYEVGHVNIQLGPRGWDGLKAEPDRNSTEGALAPAAEISPTLFQGLNWHKDSYPFVQILMLSDIPDSSGGNTIVRKADGSHFICELPPIGHAMVLQGGLLAHAVSPTTATLERITMITSYRPSDPLLPDTCILTTVRSISDNNELMKQWVTYRIKILSQRAEKFVIDVQPGSSISTMATFAAEQSAFLSETLRQMLCSHDRTVTHAREHYLKWLQKQVTPI